MTAALCFCSTGSETQRIILSCSYLCALLLLAGSDFTEAGFDAMLEWLYTSAVQGVTWGQTDTKLQKCALQAADFFGLSVFKAGIESWSSSSSTIAETTATAAINTENGANALVH